MSDRRPAGRSRCLLLLCAALLWAAAAPAAEEAALQDLWEQHMGTPDDHEAVLKACHEFAKAHPGEPLLPVARGLEEWHSLRGGRRGEALSMLAADLVAPAGPVSEGARRLAQGWLTRLDREQVAAALQAYYRKHVAYPKSLDELPAETRPPLQDRFGKPWSYKLTGFAKLQGFPDQKYALQSAFLGEASDFKSALQWPYGSRLLATPVQVVPGPAKTPAVKFTGSAAVVGAGQAASDLYVAFVGERIIVVCDYTHWKVFPRP